MEDILSFKQCIDLTVSKRHLILGNGFSVDLFPEIFNYNKLAEKITDINIKNIFNEFETTDFEYVVLKLSESLKVLQYYDESKSILNKVSEDTEKLKEILISVISNSHPENPSFIDESEYLSCYEFLKHFENGKKYSFNYDLLLYWVYMHFLNHESNNLKSDDGFRSDWNEESFISWEIGREHQQNIYYLHGAMHLFKSSKGEVYKYTWRNSDKTIGHQVRESIDNNIFPIFISEGSTDHKLKRIKENGYLSRSFSSIKSITGDLFIFGHSIRDEDDHVFDILNRNKKVKRIFISLYGDKNSQNNLRIIEKINAWRVEYNSKGREYLFYDSETAHVWNNTVLK